MSGCVRTRMWVAVLLFSLLTFSVQAQEKGVMGPLFRLDETSPPEVPTRFSVKETLINAKKANRNLNEVVVLTGFGEEGYQDATQLEATLAFRLNHASPNTLVVLDAPLTKGGLVLDLLYELHATSSIPQKLIMVRTWGETPPLSTAVKMLLTSANRNLKTSFVLLGGAQSVFETFIELMPLAQAYLKPTATLTVDLMIGFQPKKLIDGFFAASDAYTLARQTPSILTKKIILRKSTLKTASIPQKIFLTDKNPFLTAADKLATLQKNYQGRSMSDDVQSRELRLSTVSLLPWYAKKIFLDVLETICTTNRSAITNMEQLILMVEQATNDLKLPAIKESNVIWKGERLNSEIKWMSAFMSLESAGEGARLMDLYRQVNPKADQKVQALTERVNKSTAQKIREWALSHPLQTQQSTFDIVHTARTTASRTRPAILPTSVFELQNLQKVWKLLSDGQRKKYVRLRAKLSVRDAVNQALKVK